jgi:hypothetical protein
MYSSTAFPYEWWVAGGYPEVIPDSTRTQKLSTGIVLSIPRFWESRKQTETRKYRLKIKYE